MTPTRLEWLLLAVALLSTGCVSLQPAPGRGMNLRYTPREAATFVLAKGPGGATGTAANPDSTEGAARQSALAAQLAFRGAVLDVSGLHPPHLR